MGEDAEDDHEDDKGGDPRPEFIGVHDFVAEKCHKEGADRNDDDTSETRDIVVHSMDELRADNAVDG